MDKTDHPVSSPPTDAAKDHLHNIAGEASSLLTEAKEQGSEQFEHYRDFAAEQLDTLVEGAQSAASALQGKDSLGLSSYLGDLARYLGEFSHQVRDQSAEQLLQKGTQLARDNPAVFLAGSVAIGFGLSRFLRASASHGPSASSASASASRSTPPSTQSASKPYASPVPKTPQLNPGKSSDVSTHEPFTPVDPLGTGVGAPSDGPIKNDPYKGGV